MKNNFLLIGEIQPIVESEIKAIFNCEVVRETDPINAIKLLESIVLLSQPPPKKRN